VIEMHRNMMGEIRRGADGAKGRPVTWRGGAGAGVGRVCVPDTAGGRRSPGTEGYVLEGPVPARTAAGDHLAQRCWKGRRDQRPSRTASGADGAEGGWRVGRPTRIERLAGEEGSLRFRMTAKAAGGPSLPAVREDSARSHESYSQSLTPGQDPHPTRTQ